MTEEQKLNAKRATYEKTTHISIPSYDSLFSMIQSYFRFELGDIPVSMLVVGAGEEMNFRHGGLLTQTGHLREWILRKICLRSRN